MLKNSIYVTFTFYSVNYTLNNSVFCTLNRYKYAIFKIYANIYSFLVNEI